MDRNGMIDALARQRMVETVVSDMTRRELDAALKDLCQIIYLHLLTMDIDKLRDLYESGDIKFYIIRVAYIQLHGNRTPFDTQVRRFSRQSSPLDDYPDE